MSVWITKYLWSSPSSPSSTLVAAGGHSTPKKTTDKPNNKPRPTSTTKLYATDDKNKDATNTTLEEVEEDDDQVRHHDIEIGDLKPLPAPKQGVQAPTKQASSYQEAAISTEDEEEPGTSHAHCVSCMESMSKETMHGCSGTMGTIHYQCTNCYLDYLRTELAHGGAFCNERYFGGHVDSGNIISEAGQLPCPYFVVGHCDCASVPFGGLCNVLRSSDEVAVLYHTVFQRVVEAKAVVELRHSNTAIASAPTEAPTRQSVLHDVQNAINEGSWMRCPDCDFPGIKDEACMHISPCRGPACSTNWCYCCGRHRRRDHPEDCRGCDATAFYLERQPGWDAFAQTGESPALGALNEFHRRKIRYYLQRVKSETPHRLWQEFQQAYPNILRGIPTPSRSIEWNELDDPSASNPPVFGNTTEEDLLWKLPPSPETSSRRQPLEKLPSMIKVLNSRNGLLWIIAFLLSVAILCVRWSVFDHPGLEVLSDVMVAVVAYGASAFVLLREADRNDLFPNPSIPERQFLGTPWNEKPLLSQNGQWSQYRDLYVRYFVGGTALGALLIGVAEHVGGAKQPFLVTGAIILTNVLLNFLLVTTFVNHSPLPQDDNRSGKNAFRGLLVVASLFSICLSIGVGFVLCQPVYCRKAGTVLLVLGSTGLLAEIFPRLFRKNSLMWEPMSRRTGLLSYSFFVGLSAGPLFVHTGISFDIRALWIIGTSLCTCFPLLFLLYRMRDCFVARRSSPQQQSSAVADN